MWDLLRNICTYLCSTYIYIWLCMSTYIHICYERGRSNIFWFSSRLEINNVICPFCKASKTCLIIVILSLAKNESAVDSVVLNRSHASVHRLGSNEDIYVNTHIYTYIYNWVVFGWKFGSNIKKTNLLNYPFCPSFE